MADIFQEVDEEVRRERLQKLWQRYGAYVVAAAALVVAAIAAWRGYEWYIGRQAAAAGARFEAAVTLSEQGKADEAENAFAKIAAEAPAGYRILARFRAAAELVKTKPAEAAQAYDALAADDSLGTTLQDLAAVHSAMLRLDTLSFAELRQRLDPLAEQGRPFRHTARELLALSAWHHHEVAAAQKYIDMINNDPESPPLMRARIEMLSALIAADSQS
ncbi:MAG: tetratricopeptide repeat protein [Pseudolabrys sp.]|nr:tetratricopeptide repeat protein [Pseudolabrys sp.]